MRAKALLAIFAVLVVCGSVAVAGYSIGGEIHGPLHQTSQQELTPYSVVAKRVGETPEYTSPITPGSGYNTNGYDFDVTGLPGAWTYQVAPSVPAVSPVYAFSPASITVTLTESAPNAVLSQPFITTYRVITDPSVMNNYNSNAPRSLDGDISPHENAFYPYLSNGLTFLLGR
jgi:hypothetical protein